MRFVTATIFANCKKRWVNERRDLDAAALTLRKAWAIAMASHAQGKDGIAAALDELTSTAIDRAIVHIDNLTRDPDDPYFEEIIALYRRIQRSLPALAKTVPFGTNPAAQPLLAAIRHLRTADSQAKPRASLPGIWRACFISERAAIRYFSST